MDGEVEEALVIYCEKLPARHPATPPRAQIKMLAGKCCPRRGRDEEGDQPAGNGRTGGGAAQELSPITQDASAVIIE